MACCPAHEDSTPSLSLREMDDGQVLVNCFAGCKPDDILAAVGLEWRDMFPQRNGHLANPEPRHSTQKERAEVDMARSVIAVLRADQEAGKRLSAFDKECAQSAIETLRAIGEDPQISIDPMPPTLAEFMALDFPPMEPVLGPFMSQQLSLLYAPTGAGKTMLGFSLAMALSNGTDFLGWTSAGPRKVLYLDGEMAGRMVQDRFAGCSAENLYFANVQSWWLGLGHESINLASEADQAILAKWIDRAGIDVVFLDNFMTLAWKDGVSFSSDEAWTPVRRFALQLRGQGKTVFILDHANDQGRVFGTKTKEHQVDLTLTIEPVDRDDELGRAGISSMEMGSIAVIHFGKKRGFSHADPLLSSKRITIGKIGAAWSWELLTDVLLEKVKMLRKDGIPIRKIAEQLNVSYSKIQRIWKAHQMNDS